MKKRRYAIIGITTIAAIERYISWTAQQTNSAIQIVPINTISVSFIQSGTNTKQFSQQKDCTFVINGSYFGKNKESDFYPAGIWHQNGQVIYSRENRPYDANLTNTITIHQNSSNINFYFNETGVNKTETNTISFNAGPSILEHGEIKKEQLKTNTSHRQQTVPRTIIAKDKNNTTSVILFKKWSTLYKAALWLKANHFTEAINLDGWPSTAITDKTNSQNNFNEHEKLPILFCIK